MELEKQCCTAEQAKELARLGVKVETLFYWYQHKLDQRWELGSHLNAIQNGIVNYPAPNVAELGLLLLNYHVRYRYDEKLWELTRSSEISSWTANERITVFLNISPERENLARAKALIWIIDNRLIYNPGALTL